MDVYAQIAVLSRVTSIFEEQGADASGQERYIASTFCERAARRANGSLDQLERNDDDRMHSIARLAYKRGAYGYALYEDYRRKASGAARRTDPAPTAATRARRRRAVRRPRG